jgi:hypothetical protein
MMVMLIESEDMDDGDDTRTCRGSTRGIGVMEWEWGDQ